MFGLSANIVGPYNYITVYPDATFITMTRLLHAQWAHRCYFTFELCICIPKDKIFLSYKRAGIKYM